MDSCSTETSSAQVAGITYYNNASFSVLYLKQKTHQYLKLMSFII